MISSTLQAQLGTTPVTTLGVVFNRVACSQSDPLWHGPILLCLFGKCALRAKWFLWRLWRTKKLSVSTM